MGQDDQPKSKPDLKKLWPQVKALVKPRLGLLLAGMGLMVINRVAGLVLPYTSKPLLDTVLYRCQFPSQNHKEAPRRTHHHIAGSVLYFSMACWQKS